MSIESPFKFLLLKKVYEILDGDKTFGKYKSRSGKSINIGLPYLSGLALCELSTIFGLPETYSQSGAQSRWMYVEKLLKYCITNGNCSRLLEHMFSLQQFQKSFAGMEKDEIESVYKDSVQKAIDGINDNLVFSNKALVYKDKKFQIIQGNRQEISSTDMLDAILDEHKTDAFSPLTEYEQCELIGKGGFGEVYRYHNKYLDMDFTVKIYRPCFMTDEEREEGE